ncbi:acyl-CoA thioesterase [Paraglaciecola hydrolytica]|uniref:Acyl-CoA thioesterase II n=1 Tax=Paraglaciecola hydrolytica TaxID=1799789 RepID=A0A136A4E9_9ALTE|nr:thioesterase family protein [Paraglaciecola hydrolytica]KXI30000.1 acyl-CoA thioesterase II [Paraglaciecola hydrolytica]
MHIDLLFDMVKEQLSTGQNSATLSVPDTWAQGRTIYGGISASLVYSAMRQLLTPEKQLRTLNTSFIGPIEPDVPFVINIELLREGKNTSQLQGQIVQHGKVCLATLASFGINRTSKVNIANQQSHAMALPTKASFMPMIPKITPRFMRHIEIAKNVGGWPFTGSKTSELHGWMRLKKSPRTLTDAHLVALIDVWPPTVLQTLRWPAPASTMSWNLEFIYPHHDFKADDWFAYQASTRHASDGYANTEADIWDARGRLIAISRQSVTVFD